VSTVKARQDELTILINAIQKQISEISSEFDNRMDIELAMITSEYDSEIAQLQVRLDELLELSGNG
jgi:hypothetical protein